MRQNRMGKTSLLTDPEMIVHYKMNEASGDLTDSGVYNKTLTVSGTVTASSSLYRQDGASTGSRVFDGASYAMSASAASLQGFFTGNTNVSFSARIKPTAFANAENYIFDYSLTEGVESTAGNKVFSVNVTSNHNPRVRWEGSGTGNFSVTFTGVSIPLNVPSILGISRKYDSADGFFTYYCYLNSELVGIATSGDNSSGGGSAKLCIGAGQDDVTGLYWTGSIEDVAVWSRFLNEDAHRRIYADAVRPWDERLLLQKHNRQTKYRVRVKHNILDEWFDLSELAGNNYVLSASIKNAADSENVSATINLEPHSSIYKTINPLGDNSQLNNLGGTLSPLIAFRRRIKIDIAVVPQEWNVQGWEWTPVFDGVIKSYSFHEGINIDAVDLGDDLSITYKETGAFYNLGLGVSLEEQLNTVITDNKPATGYKHGDPDLIGWFPPDWELRYHEAQATDVMEILKSLANTIGFDCKYKWYDPHEEFRLTLFAPPRELHYPIYSIEKVNGNTEIEFGSAHNLSEGQYIEVFNTTNFNLPNQYVEEVLSYTRVRLNSGPGGSPAEEQSGYVIFASCETLSLKDISGFRSVSVKGESIRNKIGVRFNRKPIDNEMQILAASFNNNYSDRLTIRVASDAPARFDTSNRPEVEGDIAGTTPTAYQGTFKIHAVTEDGTATVKTDDSTPRDYTVTAYLIQFKETGSNSTATATDGTFSSAYLVGDEIVLKDTNSIDEFGEIAAFVYESSNSNIDSYSEAYDLAKSMVLDLSQPLVDFSIDLIGCRHDLEVHDLIQLPSDTLHNRWVGPLDVAIVAMTMTLEPSGCYTSLDVREERPTLGSSWARRALNSRRVKLEVTTSDRIDLLDVDSFTVASRAFKKFDVRWNIDTSRIGRTYAGTEIHASSESGLTQPFAMTADTLCYFGDSEFTSLEGYGPDLTAFTGGATYFFRMRHVDFFGNYSQGTTATISSIALDSTPRLRAKAVQSTTTVSWTSGGGNFSQPFIGLAPTEDDWTNALTATASTTKFTVPSSGTYNIRFTLKVRGAALDVEDPQADMGLFVDGVRDFIFYNYAEADDPYVFRGSVNRDFVAGEVLTFKIDSPAATETKYSVAASTDLVLVIEKT